MANNVIGEGEFRQWTNGTASAVASGDLVPVGTQVGVAMVDIPVGRTGSLAMEGEFLVPKVTTAVITQGMALIFKAATRNMAQAGAATTTGDITGAVVATAAAGNGATNVSVQLNNRIGTVI